MRAFAHGTSCGLAAALLWLPLSGCDATPKDRPTVAEAWQRDRQRARSQAAQSPEPARTTDPIATVDGSPIPRDEFVRLLISGRGVTLLEQLVVLELARQAAEAEGLSVTADDVEYEHKQAMASLLESVQGADGGAMGEDDGRRMLDQILQGRGISQEEYRLGMERNAYLRKLASARLKVSEEQLQQEYRQTYGERVVMRHIQVANQRDAEEVRRRLAAGEDFGQLAERMSINRITAPDGGLVEPFGREDPRFPEPLRSAAFRLEQGEVSKPMRIGSGFHIIRVEARLPAQNVPFDQVRDELRTKVRNRQIDAEMQRLSADLFDQATVQVADPELRETFFDLHPELRP